MSVRVITGKSSIVVVREGTVVSGKSIVYIDAVGSDHFAKPDKIITIPDKNTIQKHVMKGITLQKKFVVVPKGKFEDDSNIERLLTLWRRAKEKEMEYVVEFVNSDNIKIEKGVQHRVHGIVGTRKLTDDNNLDSDAHNYSGLDRLSILAAFAKQYGIWLDILDKRTCTAMPLGEEVSDTSTNQSLPDEIVNRFNESITVSIDHSRTFPTKFLSSDRDMMFVSNCSAETVSAKNGVSHRGISTESRNRVSNTGNTEDLSTTQQITAESTETGIGTELQNGRESTDAVSKDNVVNVVESTNTQEGDGEGEEDVLQWKPHIRIVFKQTGYSGSDSSSDEDEEGEGASYRRVQDRKYYLQLLHAQQRYDEDDQQRNTDSDSFEDVARIEMMEDAYIDKNKEDPRSSSSSEVEVERYDGDVDMTEGDVAECRSKTKGRARVSYRRTYMMYVPAMAASEGEIASVHHPVTERVLRRAHAAVIYDARQGDTDCDSFDDVAHVEFMTDNIADHIK